MPAPICHPAKAVLICHGLRIVEVADLLGVTPLTLGRWLNRRETTPPRRREQLAQVLTEQTGQTWTVADLFLDTPEATADAR